MLIVALVSGGTAAAVTHVSTADANPSGVSQQTPTLPTEAEPTGPHATAQLSGKWALYEVKNKTRVGSNGSGTVRVACNDADDVPVAASCFGGSGRLKSTRHKNWANQKQPAESRCTRFNNTTQTIESEITMICQRVAGPEE